MLVPPVKMNHNHENIVIGSSLSALLFAYENNYPVFFTSPDRPFRFDYVSPIAGLEKLNREINDFNGATIAGVPRTLVWERALFALSLKGLAPMGALCSNMRYDDGVLSCFNEYSKIAETTFDHAHYFGDTGITGLQYRKRVASRTYICYDWIAFHRGGKHYVDHIKTQDSFVQRIWFYPSDRIDGATAIKDVCAVSYLTEEQLAEFDYSETMARFKVVYEMESRGLKGPSNGLGPTGKPKHYKFKTSHTHREKKELSPPMPIETKYLSCGDPIAPDWIEDFIRKEMSQ